MTQQSNDVVKPRSNIVQATEEEDEAGDVLEGGAVAKDVVDEADTSIAYHTRHPF